MRIIDLKYTKSIKVRFEYYRRSKGIIDLNVTHSTKGIIDLNIKQSIKGNNRFECYTFDKGNNRLEY